MFCHLKQVVGSLTVTASTIEAAKEIFHAAHLVQHMALKKRPDIADLRSQPQDPKSGFSKASELALSLEKCFPKCSGQSMCVVMFTHL